VLRNRTLQIDIYLLTYLRFYNQQICARQQSSVDA